MAADSGFFQWVVFLIGEYGPKLLRGAGVTLLIALIGTIVGCIIGLLVGVIHAIPAREIKNPLRRTLVHAVQGVMAAYVEIFRGTPMIVQAVVIYYGAMTVFQIDMSPLFAGFFVVSINTGAYMAETVRGGILAVPHGQVEAGKALGMHHFQTMFRIVLPQALRNILPQICNNFIINIKDTSVLMVISVTELFYVSQTAAGTYYRYFEVYFITCCMYFIMTFTISKLLRCLEKKLAGSKNYDLVNEGSH